MGKVHGGSHLLPVLGRLTRLLRQVQLEDELSAVALTALDRLSRTGSLRLTELARAERISQPGMTQLIGRLERAGLTRRLPDPHDRRGVLVELTDAGRAALARCHEHYVGTLDALLTHLGPDEREAIAGALPALTRLAEVAAEPDSAIGRPATRPGAPAGERG